MTKRKQPLANQAKTKKPGARVGGGTKKLEIIDRTADDDGMGFIIGCGGNGVDEDSSVEGLPTRQPRRNTPI